MVVDENPRTPVAGEVAVHEEVLFFNHIDGMYSLCHTQMGKHVHLVAWTQVVVVGGWNG